MSLEHQQKAVADHDEANWLHPDRHDALTHNVLHIAKTLGQIASALEAIEDGKTSPDTRLPQHLIADLIIEGLRLANIEGLDAEELVRERMAELRARAAESSPPGILPPQ